MKILDIVSSIFLEDKVDTSSKALKVFYNMDIHIKNPNTEIPEQPVQQEPTQQAIQPAPQPPAQQVPTAPQIAAEEKIAKKAKKVFLEDEFTLGNKNNNNGDYVYKNEGVLVVPKAEFENIQSLDDLLDYLGDNVDDSGNRILDEAAIELVLAMTGITQTPLEDLVKKEDKVLIDVSYGNKKEDSIGFKVLKRDGVNNLSIVMKKDNEILDAKFDLKNFNSQLLAFRNSVVNKK